jgi:hypothetical protein
MKDIIKGIIHGKVIFLELTSSALPSIKAHPPHLKIHILPA